ncbi:basic amino acid ABC transporter substrate-binding protein [Pengzhenrongella sicca]|uniref:Basic amino acid ABC transporter substrate-binding protein n=1 Tax=Pengzhenrongella sicca TaxID=2819238 RepID=A0A8A4ZD67_9MICO|nr:basic amino acid ABC transporter substrate-binding protein [Pengzhenrongella sicca]QTE28833.1 basic amino acid ABC transporter substrate-binding protein [Pengzhenrongella sicca]
MRTPTRRIGTLVALSAVAALALSACGGGDAPATSDSGVPLVEAGKLIACTHLPYEPFEFNDGGTIVGFDVDVVAEIAADLDVELEVVDTPFEGIQTGEDLSTGKCDVAAAGMTITDVREEALDFSEPYFEATQALMVKADSDIATLADLEGKKLGVQAATTGEIYAQDEAPGAELVQFEDLALLQTAVQTGQVDAAINDNGVLLDFVSKNDDVQVVTEFDTGEQYGLGVKTGNADLLEAVNATLARLASDGTYDTIYEKWLGVAPATS